MLGMWAVLAVVCLASQAHAQLGEGVEGDARAWEAAEDMEDSYNGKEEARAEEEPVTILLRSQRGWKPLEETFQGCIPAEADVFHGLVMRVNLTEVMDTHVLVSSVEEACFHLCFNKAAFSLYLTVSPALNGSVDHCGCHHQGELNLDSIAEGCEDDGYRVYCGPYNMKCFGRAGGPGTPTLPLLALPLLLALLSGLADVGATSPLYFGFNR